MGSINVFHKNEWHDYTGGSDHSIDEIAACDAEHDADGMTRHEHVVIIGADEYLKLTSGASAFVPIPVSVEDVVIGTIKQMRQIDEPTMRFRWGESVDRPLDVRVALLLGERGRDFGIVMETLRQAGLA